MLKRIDPTKLNGKQKEIYNFQKSAALLADYGFNCIKLTDDWEGADFLAHHFDGKTTLRVQLKARLTIDRKYLGQDLWMNFPSAGTWYLVPHDTLVELIGDATNWLNTTSWMEKGLYSSANPSLRLLQHLHPFAVEDGPYPPAAAPSSPPDSDGPSASIATRPAKPLSTRRQNPGHWRNQNVSDAVKALSAAGYTCSPSPTHLKGVDLVARSDERTAAIHVRCPGRLDIRKDQIGNDISIAFPDQDGIWYLVAHDELVNIAGQNTPWQNSSSWQESGWYSSANPSRRLRAAIARFALSYSRSPSGQEP